MEQQEFATYSEVGSKNPWADAYDFLRALEGGGSLRTNSSQQIINAEALWHRLDPRAQEVITALANNTRILLNRKIGLLGFLTMAEMRTQAGRAHSVLFELIIDASLMKPNSFGAGDPSRPQFVDEIQPKDAERLQAARAFEHSFDTWSRRGYRRYKDWVLQSGVKNPEKNYDALKMRASLEISRKARGSFFALLTDKRFREKVCPQKWTDILEPYVKDNIVQQTEPGYSGSK